LFYETQQHENVVVLDNQQDIEKTYGGMVGCEEQKKTKEFLHATGYFRKDLIVFKNFNIFRSSDIFMVLILAYNLILYFINLNPLFYVAYVPSFQTTHTLERTYK
jgi:hypothetical protein